MDSSKKSGLSPIDVMELARVYQETSEKSCYTEKALENYAERLEMSVLDILQICHEKVDTFTRDKLKTYTSVMKNFVQKQQLHRKASCKSEALEDVNNYVRTMEEFIQQLTEILSPPPPPSSSTNG